MAATDLLFSPPPLGPDSPVALVFGETDTPAVPVYTLSGAGTVTGLRLRVAAYTVVRLESVAAITGLRLRCGVAYDINVSRPMVGVAASRWQQARPRPTSTWVRYGTALRERADSLAHWRDAAQAHGAVGARWQTSRQLLQAARAVDQQARPVAAQVLQGAWQEARGLRRAAAGRFAEALGLAGSPAAQAYQEAIRLRGAAWQAFGTAGSVQALWISRGGYGLQVRLSWHGRYQEAWPPRPGMWLRPPVPGPHPCYMPALPAELVFVDAAAGALPAGLVFLCERGAQPGPPAVIVVPVRRYYMVSNEIQLQRADTGAALHAYSFSMALDDRSWTWQWSATLHRDAAPHLGRDAQGDPAVIHVAVNGIPFALRLERIARDRRFSPERWHVSGRGLASVLAAPHAPAMAFGNTAALSAQQIMASALTVNGVSLGWSIDWGLTDWPVPAGAWSYQGSYIDAVTDIASAVGGYIQPHATLPTLRVLPRYPAAPWAWASITPDIEIPDAAAEIEGTDYIDKPAYNRVYVGGIGDAGVFGPVTRAGTAGDQIAPQALHSLITHADAHRQRGLAVLSDTGAQEHVTLRLPILPELGIVTPGKFVRYTGQRTVLGIVRSTSIDWSRPVLRQTIGVETHA